MSANHPHKYIIRFIGYCLLLIATSAKAQTQSLSGIVSISGSENSALATIRIVDQGIGTTSKLNGSYFLEDIAPGKHIVEYSYIGHKTVRQQITWTLGEAKQLDVVMEEAPIMLTTTLVTPNGEDAVEYILNHVWKKAEQKRAKMPAFEAKVSTVLSYSDFDVLMLYDYLPRMLRMTLMGLASVAGIKSIVKLLIAHPNLDATTKCDLLYKKKSFKWENFAVSRCSTKLAEEEKKVLYKPTKHDDLYDLIYGDENKLRSKKTKKELKGSYEDGDKMIFVIEGMTKDKERYTMHVVEDTWDVLHLKIDAGMMVMQAECRPTPGGLNLPVSINRKLIFVDKTPEQVREMLEEMAKEASEEKEEAKDEKKSKKKHVVEIKNEEFVTQMNAFVENCKKQGLHMVINQGVSISYK